MKWCCDMMRDNTTGECPHGHTRQNCPDCLIDQHSDGSFGIMIKHGGGGHITINFCPWCGASLKTKKRTIDVVVGNYDASLCEDEGVHYWTVAAFSSEAAAERFEDVVSANTKAALHGKIDRSAMMDQEIAPNFDKAEQLWYHTEEVPLDPDWDCVDCGRAGNCDGEIITDGDGELRCIPNEEKADGKQS